MRFMVSLAIGAVFGLAAGGITASANSLEAIFGLVVFMIILPVIGGFLNGIRNWSNEDVEEEHPSETSQPSGNSAVVVGGLFLGAILGMLIGLGQGG